MTNSQSHCEIRNKYWWLPTALLVPVVATLVYSTNSALNTTKAKQREVNILLRMLTSTTLPRVAVNQDMIVQTGNLAAANLMELPLEDLIGADMNQFIPQRHHPAHDSGLSKFLSCPGPIHEIHCELLTQKKNLVPVELNLASIRCEEGHLFAVKMRRRENSGR